MQPLAPTDVTDVRIPDPLGAALTDLTGGPPPSTVGELADTWCGQVRDHNWRDALLAPGTTTHVVEIDDRAYPVNCALDGLMLPLLADRDGTLTTSDPVSGQSMSVRVSPSGRHAASHPSAVLALGVSPGAGAADDAASDVDRFHECACPHINLFTDHDAYHRWAEDHPSVASLELTLPRALDLAARLVGAADPVRL